MIVNKEKFKLSVTELILLVISVLFLIGINSWFSVCPANEDMIMSCHWAGEMLKVMGLLILVVAVIHLIIADTKIKLGMDIPLICICLVTAFIPGGIINICQNTEMVCRQSTQTWTIILSIVLLVITLVDIIFYVSYLSRQKHQRKVTE